MDIQLTTLSELARIIRPCAHTQPQPLPPCSECTQARVANFTMSISAEIRRQVIDIASAQSLQIKHLEQRAESDSKRIDKLLRDIEARTDAIKRLNEMVMERDHVIADMKLDKQAERAAAVSYVVGPLAARDDE